ncbi:MAG: hypothetical protein Q8Q59_08720 [Luteolibacter sp.]|nr:hypothetical protein [Luteolibacter sp.]
MTHTLVSRTVIALAAVIATAGSAFAAPYQKGDRVESFQSKTQHEQAYTFKPAETRYLLISHDMETGKKANAVLTRVGRENLSRKKAVYLANIHGMPGVGRMFALPKMKKYSHTIILGDDAKLIARFPEERGKVTVLALEEGKVVSVQFWKPGDESLDNFLK